MRKAKVITIAGFIVSIVLLCFSLKDIRFHDITTTLQKADPWLIPLPIIFILCAVLLCAFRWSRLIGNSVHFLDAFAALMIGLFVNNVLPARIGEVARAYVISKKRKLSFTFSFSTVLLDRFFDLTGLLLLAFVFFPEKSLPPAVSRSIYILIALLIVCVGCIILLSRERFANKLAGMSQRIRRPLFTKLTERVFKIQENLKRINSPFNLLLTVTISFCTWFSMTIALYLVILMLGIQVDFCHVPFVCALLNLGLTIPSSPGYVGVYQFLLVYLLTIFGVPKHEGFTISLIYHAMWFVPYNIIGFIYLLKEHLKIRELRKFEGSKD